MTASGAESDFCCGIMISVIKCKTNFVITVHMYADRKFRESDRYSGKVNEIFGRVLSSSTVLERRFEPKYDLYRYT